jgi:mRNA interferase MazF
VAVVKRGEVHLVALDPTIGSKIQKTRPCLIISPDTMDLCTVIVAPLAKGAHPAPFRISVKFQGKEGRILLDQIRCVDRSRLVKRLGTLPMTRVLTVLRGMFEE